MQIDVKYLLISWGMLIQGLIIFLLYPVYRHGLIELFYSNAGLKVNAYEQKYITLVSF